MPRKKKTLKLTGDALLAQVKAMPESSEKEKAITCGYVGKNNRARHQEFKNAILKAQGINLDPVKNGSVKHVGRPLSYKVFVHANGGLLIGPGYTEQMGLEPGMGFDVKLGRKKIELRIEQ